MTNSTQKAQAQASYELTGLTHLEKQRLMVLSVLEQKRGRELAQQAKVQGHLFEASDWKAFKVQFRAKFSEKSLKELMQFASRYYGLKTIEAVAEVHNRFKNAYTLRERLATQKAA